MARLLFRAAAAAAAAAVDTEEVFFDKVSVLLEYVRKLWVSVLVENVHNVQLSEHNQPPQVAHRFGERLASGTL